jgi:hypothetical protein
MPTDRADAASPVPIKLLATIVVVVFAVYVCWKSTLEFPNTIHWSNWALSEWLINYQGGFVRRGLAGQLIRSLAGDGGRAIATVNGLVFSVFASFCGLLTCLVVLSRRVTPLMAVMLLLVPGGIYGMVMGNEFYFCKEMVFNAYLAAVATLFLLAVRTEGSSFSRAARVLTIVLIVVGSAILPFLHEAFLFMSAVPTGVIVYWLGSRVSHETGRSAAAAYLAVVIAQFLLLAMFKGNDQIASAIWSSIHPEDQKLISSDGTIGGAILAISWSIWTASMLPLQVLTSGNAWNWALMIVASAGYLVVTTFAGAGPMKKAYRRAAWVATLYGLCLAGSLPLYIFGWDWGRWIAVVNLSVVILICAGEFHQALPVPVGAILRPWAGYSRTLVCATLGLAVLVGLTFKLPECCLVGSGEPFYRLIQKFAGLRPWSPSAPPPGGFGPPQAQPQP